MWKYELQTLLEEGVNSKEVITVAARKSLRGSPANIAMRLGVKATIEELLTKFDGMYGTVEPSESLLTQFYSAQQEETEEVKHIGHVVWKIFSTAHRSNVKYLNLLWMKC